MQRELTVRRLFMPAGRGGSNRRRGGKETEEGTDGRRRGEGLAGGTPRVAFVSFHFLFFPCTGSTIPCSVQGIGHVRPIPHLERGIVDERPMAPSHGLATSCAFFSVFVLFYS